jgi:hypothetical protein
MSDKNNVITMNKADWLDFYIENSKKSTRLSSNAKIILDFKSRSELTRVQTKILNSIVDAEYKTYLARLDFATAKTNANNKAKAALDSMKKLQQSEKNISRKKREHELITIGLLTDVCGFEKDRGLILGALLNALDSIQDNVFKQKTKARGDELLFQIEQAKRLKSENQN